MDWSQTFPRSRAPALTRPLQAASPCCTGPVYRKRWLNLNRPANHTIVPESGGRKVRFSRVLAVFAYAFDKLKEFSIARPG
jgi:hypothetical protein